jgi:hypothetical protein
LKENVLAAVFIKRDQDGTIVAVSRQQQEDGWEPLADDSPELAAFTGALGAGQGELSATDLGLVRVLEDVIDLLIERGVIRFTDFPEAAQSKLLQRRSMRASLRGLDLLSDEEGNGII